MEGPLGITLPRDEVPLLDSAFIAGFQKAQQFLSTIMGRLPLPIFTIHVEPEILSGTFSLKRKYPKRTFRNRNAAMASTPQAADFSAKGQIHWLKSKHTPSPPPRTAVDFGMRVCGFSEGQVQERCHTS